MRTTPMSMIAVLLVGGALAQPVAGAVKDGKVTRSAREELARLDQELAAQRALLVKILQLQLERDQQMLRLAQGTAEPVTLAEPPPAAPVLTSAVAPEPPTTRAAVPPKRREPQTGVITGRVKVTGAIGPAYVFVEDVRGPLANGTAEIRQEGKQFAPRVLVIPRGTTVTFPNFDTVFHNVFSISPGNSFDLGASRAGDAVKSRVMNTPGVVEIFCNMHSRMSASVLVTPSGLFARAGSDGAFRIEGVPVGAHRISAWAGGASLATAAVDVSPAGGEAQLELKVAEPGAHLNKLGQPYGSYGD